MPPSSRACDRCYAIKSRCIFDDQQNACQRCRRLCHRCVTERPELKAGRPRTRTLSSIVKSQAPAKSPSLTPSALSPSAVSASSPEVVEALKDFELSEISLAQYLVEDQRLDRRFVNSFAIDAFFSDTMQSSLIKQLLTAPAQVKDAMLALAGALKAEEDSDSVVGSEATLKNMEWCCNGLQQLRTSDCATEDDARAILFVADCLVSVNDLTVGHGFLPIAQAALLAIEPWYHQLLTAPSSQFDAHLVPLMFAEIMECSKCGEVPTFQWSQPSTQLVERSYGVAQEALPFLYDICLLGRDMKHSALDNITIQQRISDIHRQVEIWVPSIEPRDLVHQGLFLDQVQTSQMIRHAVCYKLLAKLLLAQLNAQTKDNRITRAHLGQQIRDEVAKFITTETPQVLYLLWPYFVACTELSDPDERPMVLDKMRFLSGGIATQSCNTMYKFLHFVWATAAINPKITWLELVASGSEFSIGP